MPSTSRPILGAAAGGTFCIFGTWMFGPSAPGVDERAGNSTSAVMTPMTITATPASHTNRRFPLNLFIFTLSRVLGVSWSRHAGQRLEPPRNLVCRMCAHSTRNPRATRGAQRLPPQRTRFFIRVPQIASPKANCESLGISSMNPCRSNASKAPERVSHRLRLVTR